MTPAVFHLVVNGERRAWCLRNGFTYVVSRVGPHLLLRQPVPLPSRSFDTPAACQAAMEAIAPLSDWEVVA